MTKIKIRIKGVEFKVNDSVVYNDSFKVNRTEAAKMIKQYVAAKFPHVICRVSSAVFAGGDSCDVFLCTESGGQLNNDEFLDIRDFSEKFEAGRYDSYADCYMNYNRAYLNTDDGHAVYGDVKYVSVNNRPKFDTPEYVLGSVLHEGETVESACAYIKPATAAKAKEILATRYGITSEK